MTFHKYHNEASTHSTQPPSGAWSRIEAKLDHESKRKDKRNFSYLIRSIAAVGIILIAFVLAFESTNMTQKISNGNIAEWENLELPSNKSYYDVERVRSLNKSYINLGF